MSIEKWQMRNEKWEICLSFRSHQQNHMPKDLRRITLIVQDHVEKAAVHRQPMAIVIDEAKPLELVHEMTDL
jgi:hypothetical protein